VDRRFFHNKECQSDKERTRSQQTLFGRGWGLGCTLLGSSASRGTKLWGMHAGQLEKVADCGHTAEEGR